jgi:hypothetical protein
VRGERRFKRLKLEHLITHYLNRGGLPLSGKHVHALWNIILFKLGFVKSRYEFVIVIKLQGEERAKCVRHNANFHSKDTLLPPFLEESLPDELYGLLTKNHLVMGAKCVKHGMPMLQ